MDSESRWIPDEEITDALISETLTRQTWHFASSMPENPHEYALKYEWTGPINFARVIRHIQRFGYWGRWRKNRYRQWDTVTHFHWILFPPYLLINRKTLEVKGLDYPDQLTLEQARQQMGYPERSGDGE